MAKFTPQTSNVYACSFTNPGSTGNHYIEFPSNNSLNLASVNWTIEFWIKPDTYIGSTSGIFLKGPFTGLNQSYESYMAQTSGYLTIVSNGTGYSPGPGARLTPNTWNHVALCQYTGSNTQFFINGNYIYSTAGVTNSPDSDTPLIIGADRYLRGGLYGKLSNFRIIKGQVIYTGNFNITNYPFQLPNNSIGYHGGTTNVASSLTGNVVLLTCNAPTIKSNGNTTLNASVSGLVTPYLIDPSELQNFSYFFPGNGSSASFAQNSTVLVTNSTNSLNLNTDFTIETWFYPTSNNGVVLERGYGGERNNSASYVIVWDNANNQLNFASANANNGTYVVGSLTGPTGNIGNPTLNKWNHVAVSHTGTTYRGFLNGSLNMNITNNANVPYAALGRGITIGGMFNNGQTFSTGMPANTVSGYISNLRIIRGNSIYNSAFTVANTQLSNIVGTVLLTGLTPAYEDLIGLQTLAVNGMNEIQISTFSPFTANGIVNTITANSAGVFSYTTGQRKSRVYSKLNTPYTPTAGTPTVAKTIGIRIRKVNDRTLTFAYQPLPTSAANVKYQYWS